MSSKIVTAPGAYPRIPRSFFTLVRSVFRTVVALSCPGERKGKDVALHWRVIYMYILANEFIIALLFSRHRLELSLVPLTMIYRVSSAVCQFHLELQGFQGFIETIIDRSSSREETGVKEGGNTRGTQFSARGVQVQRETAE